MHFYIDPAGQYFWVRPNFGRSFYNPGIVVDQVYVLVFRLNSPTVSVSWLHPIDPSDRVVGVFVRTPYGRVPRSFWSLLLYLTCALDAGRYASYHAVLPASRGHWGAFPRTERDLLCKFSEASGPQRWHGRLPILWYTRRGSTSGLVSPAVTGPTSIGRFRTWMCLPFKRT